MTEEIKVTEEDVSGFRIDKYIADFKKIMTRSQLKHRNAVFFVNGREVKYSHRVKTDEIITIKYIEAEAHDIVPEKIDIDIIYEDENVVVVNKPQGMVVHPGDGNFSGTLVNGILYYLKNHSSNFSSEAVRPGIVHRLDKDTSGVIIIAKNVESHEYLSAQFRDRTTVKKYLTIVKGIVKDEEGIIDTFIKRDRTDRKKFTTDKAEGRHALTEYKVLKRFEHYTLCLIKLHTGRTHQIRVHMKHLGHPVLGDPVYSRKDSNYPDASLMLHAFVLSIDIPGRGRMQFSAFMPERFKAMLRKKS